MVGLVNLVRIYLSAKILSMWIQLQTWGPLLGSLPDSETVTGHWVAFNAGSVISSFKNTEDRQCQLETQCQ